MDTHNDSLSSDARIPLGAETDLLSHRWFKPVFFFISSPKYCQLWPTSNENFYFLVRRSQVDEGIHRFHFSNKKNSHSLPDTNSFVLIKKKKYKLYRSKDDPWLCQVIHNYKSSCVVEVQYYWHYKKRINWSWLPWSEKRIFNFRTSEYIFKNVGIELIKQKINFAL